MKILLFIIALLLPVEAYAARDFWVSKSSSGDTNPCNNSSTVLTTAAKLTIKEGIKCLTQAGDTLHIGDGTYLENISIDHSSLPTIGNGTSYNAGNAITVTAINYRQVIIDVSNAIFVAGGIDYWIIKDIVFDGSNTTRTSDPHNTYSGTGHIRWDGIESRNNKKNFPNSNPGAGMFIDNAGYTEVLNCEMHHNGATHAWPIPFDGTQAPYGFYVHAANSLIDGCLVHDNGANGIQYYHSLGLLNGGILRNSTIYDNGYNLPNHTSLGVTYGPFANTTTPMQIYNNLFYWTRSSRLAPHMALDLHFNAVVYNNTVVNYPDGGIIQGNGDWNGFARNNIAVNNNRISNSYPNFDGGKSTSSNNLCTPSNNATTCQNTVANVAAVNFVDPSGTPPNFHLQAASTAAINLGTLSICATCGPGGTSITITNYSGTSRDIGWDEYIESGSPVQTPELVFSSGADTNSGTTLVDQSGKGHTCTFSTGVTWTTGSKYGSSALVFDGTGAVTCNDSNFLDVTNAMTLEAWVFPTGAPASVDRAAIYKNSVYWLFPTVAGLGCTDGNSLGGWFSNPNYGVCGVSPLPTNTWSHLAVTYDRDGGANNMILYLNGAAFSAVTFTGDIPVSSGTLQIGGDQFGEFFIGRIDEIRIYNYARSSGQIATDRDTAITSVSPSVTAVRMGTGGIKCGAVSACLKLPGG